MEVVGGVGGLADDPDGGGDMFFMRQGGLQRLAVVPEVRPGRVDGAQGHMDAVVLQVVQDLHACSISSLACCSNQC